MSSEAPATPGSPTSPDSPTERPWWANARALLAGLLALVTAAAVLAAFRSGEQHGPLDPRSAEPHGSRAIASLLADRGVSGEVETGFDAARDAIRPDTTLLISEPDLLTATQRSTMATAVQEGGGRIVLIAPGQAASDDFTPGVRASSATRPRVLQPRCALPAARRAGNALLGGSTYSTAGRHTDACYPHHGAATLVRVPGRNGSDTVLAGSQDFLTNDRLDEQGNASLALHLLGARNHLLWYLPSPHDTGATSPAGERSFLELIPRGWLWASLQLALAAALAALWRARRLGPLVRERLPVRIPASETTEGRARLYRQVNARDRASDALRTATRRRLAPLVGVDAGQAHRPEVLLPAVTARLSDHASGTDALLFGPPPSTDADLIRLADELDRLQSAMTSRTATTATPDEKDPAP